MASTPRASGLLRQVALRVLPAAVFFLLLIWMMVSHVSERVFQAEVDAKLDLQAESLALVARARLRNLVTTVRDLANNDLVINGLIDPDAETKYLKAFLRSIAIEGSSDFPVVLTDYRGRPIAGRDLSAWDRLELTQWNDQVSQEQPMVALKDDGLVIGVPTYVANLVEGMLVVHFSREQLQHIIRPIGARGQVEIVSIREKDVPFDAAQRRHAREAHSQSELDLTDSNNLKIISSIPHETTSNASSYFQWFMLVAFLLDLIALVCGILAAVYLIIKPLKRFIIHLQCSEHEEQVDQFDAGNAPLEIGHLADAFNRFVMLEKELLQERSEQAEKLKLALEREKHLNGLQRQFVSMVCHEFRTPLAVIDGNAYRLISRYKTMPPERLEGVLSKIRLSVSRLTDLMESVLNAARLEAGKIKFEPQPCNPNELIQEVVANYQEVNSKRRIVTELEQLPHQFVMDPKLMRQVISNLLSNAIKYSSVDDKVGIEASATVDGDLTVSVHDEGVGIPPAELEHLFERFFRASTSTGIAGTGIGLHMVKALVDLHDGHINVSSEKGKGTTFSVSLPLRNQKAVEPELDAAAVA